MDSAQQEQQFFDAYESYADAVFSYCYTYIPDRQQALKLVQQVFSTVWERATANTSAITAETVHRIAEMVVRSHRNGTQLQRGNQLA